MLLVDIFFREEAENIMTQKLFWADNFSTGYDRIRKVSVKFNESENTSTPQILS